MVRLRPRVLVVAAWLASCALTGCFGPGGGSGATPDAGSAGRGGSGGGSGSDKELPPGFGGSPDLIDCPNGPCELLDPSGPLATVFEECCTVVGNCSIRTPGSQCTELPAADARCGTVRVAGSDLPGCCINNLCGIDIGVFNLGCVDPTMLRASGVDAELRACADASVPDGPLDDAGTDDAGR